MPGKKTFIILTPGFPKDEADSTCLPMLQSFVRTIQSLYPELTIVVLSFQYPYHTKTYNWFGIPVIPFSGRNKGGFSRLITRKRIAACLKKLNRKHPVAGILSFWLGECALAGKRFSKQTGIPHRCWILGQDAAIKNKFVKKISPNPEELIALSDFIQEEMEKNHAIRPAQVIPPGIDTKKFTNRPVQKDIDIVAAGSLIPLKQYEILIHIVAAIKKEVPAIRVVLIGAGPERVQLENSIDALGLQSSILLAGELSHRETIEWMERGKIFLHTSSYEGFGVVCTEALGAGARVISFTRPMKTGIEKWQIAASKEDMIRLTLEALKDPHPDLMPVIPFLVEDSARKMMQLFSI